MQLWIIKNSSSQVVYHFQKEEGGKEFSKDEQLLHFTPMILSLNLLQNEIGTSIRKLKLGKELFSISFHHHATYTMVVNGLNSAVYHVKAFENAAFDIIQRYKRNMCAIKIEKYN